MPSKEGNGDYLASRAGQWPPPDTKTSASPYDAVAEKVTSSQRPSAPAFSLQERPIPNEMPVLQDVHGPKYELSSADRVTYPRSAVGIIARGLFFYEVFLNRS